jgi:hypothetical protein
VAAIASCADVAGEPQGGTERVESAEQASSTCLAIQRGLSGTVTDAYITTDPLDPTKATATFGSSTSLTTGRVGAGAATAHSLVWFDLTQVPPASTVTGASITFQVSPNGAGDVEMHRALAPWDEASVSYASFANAFDPAVSASFSTVGLVAGPVAVDVTALAQAWVNGLQPNYGVALTQLPSARTQYRSSEAGVVSRRPRLDLCYVPSQLCAGVVCAPLDACHVAGTCDPLTGLCSNPPAPDGTACTDGNACTTGDACLAGVCTAPGVVSCPAAGVCQVAGTCDSATGLCSSPTSAADGTVCTDGNACTAGDTCELGACTGSTAPSAMLTGAAEIPGPGDSDGFGSAALTLDAAAGTICWNVAWANIGAPTAMHIHSGAVGVAGAVFVGLNPTASGCVSTTVANIQQIRQNPQNFYVNIHNASYAGGAIRGQLQRANACAPVDACHAAGACDPVTGACSVPAVANGTPCDDGNACTQVDTCQNGVCTGASPVTCSAADSCHGVGACNPATGVCSSPALADGTSCSDGNACTVADTCQAGVCTPGAAVTCAAPATCHVQGTCDPATGVCSTPNAANGTPCNDGSACTQVDTCQNGVCTGASPVVCAALDACHLAGTCDPLTGQCSNPNAANGAPCSDGNACTQSDGCQGGVCVGTNPVTCVALNSCHVAGSCDPATGVCSNPNKADGTVCNDGSLCTTGDSCQNGTCTGNPVLCSPLDQCHVAGTCNIATGFCTNPNAANGTTCNDGNGCTQTDVCQAGICTGSNLKVCVPIDACHAAGTCTAATGLCSTPNAANGTACNDGDSCTQTDTCTNGVCIGSNPVSGSCTTGQPGACSPGTLSCSNSVSTCVPFYQASAEVCDGTDNDCDGAIDEGACVGPGSVSWQATYALAAGTTNVGKGVAVDSAGNVFVAGGTFDGIDYDAMIQKYTSAGVLVWTKTYAGAFGGDDEALSAAVDSAGNVIAVGYEDNGSDFDFWIGKYDTNGNVVFTRRIDTGGQDDYARGVTVDGSNNIFFAGASTTAAKGYDLQLYKLPPAGSPTTQSVAYNSAGTNDDLGIAISLDAAGNSLVVGAKSTLATGYDGLIAKFPAAFGAPTWTKTYAGAGTAFDYGFGAATDGSNNVYAAGVTQVNLQNDTWVRKLASNGNTTWTQTHAGASSGADAAYDVCVDATGSVVVAGYEIVTGFGANTWVRKYDSAGNTTWTLSYNGPGNAEDHLFGCAIGSGNNIFVTGDVAQVGGGVELWLAKVLP